MFNKVLIYFLWGGGVLLTVLLPAVRLLTHTPLNLGDIEADMVGLSGMISAVLIRQLFR